MTPYQNLTQLKTTSDYKIFTRVIPHHQDDIEFKWHRDNGDRYITIKSGLNWKLQFENELPFTLILNHTYFIKKDQWHRVLKGQEDLLIEIKEFF